jgi:glutamyl-tRNA synthetase
VLRIEDTDESRNFAEAIGVILDGLRWLGLDWDEGPETADPNGPCRGDRGPYFQSRRGELYRRHVEALLASGNAYERDGAIRFRMRREPVLIPDLIVGDVTRELTGSELEDPDFVIVRSDGQPVFHLTNVIDDLEMGITHVIRGEDHLSNTAKHIALFDALGVAPPAYAHIPLILNADGSKMSKRDTGAALSFYMMEGYLPDAVVNHLCLLGWSPKDNREKMALGEVAERFDLGQILRHNAKFGTEKLLWLQGEYARELPPERFRELARKAFADAGIDTGVFPEDYARGAIDTCIGKIRLFTELPGYAGFYFKPLEGYDPEAAAKSFLAANRAPTRLLREAFAADPEFTPGSLEAALKRVCAEVGLKPKVLVHPIRVACTGKGAGPSLYHLLAVLGREEVLARLDRALADDALWGAAA